jgi:hypothetical protein
MVAAAAGAAGGGGPSAELRQIALFIAKFKLEATKTKLMLARLTPPRRRWVMTNFTQSGTATNPTTAVEQYISQCERTNAWGSATAGSSFASSAPKPVVGGVKRPLTSTGTSFDPNKRHASRLMKTVSLAELVLHSVFATGNILFAISLLVVSA